MLEQPEFGQRLKQLRVERGLSQSALADGFLSTSYLSRLESGARPPTRRIVAQLAERLSVAESDFDAARSDGSSLARLVAVAASAGTSGEESGSAYGTEAAASPPAVHGSVDDTAGPASPTSALPAHLTDALMAALAADAADPALRWQAGWIVAHTRRAQRRTDDELRLFTQLAELAESMDVSELRVRSLAELARTQAAAGEFAAARRAAEQAFALADGLGTEDRLMALHAVVSAQAESGHLSEARENADLLCRLAADAGTVEHVKALWASAAVRVRQADQAGARRLLESALSELESRTDPVLWMRLRLAAASLYLQAAEPQVEAAAARLDEAERAVELLGTQLHRDQLRALRARLAFEEGRYDEARELAGQDEEPLRRLSFRDGIRLQSLRAQLRMRAGEAEAGTLALQDLARRAQESLNVDLAAEIWRDLAQTAAGLRTTS